MFPLGCATLSAPRTATGERREEGRLHSDTLVNVATGGTPPPPNLLPSLLSAGTQKTLGRIKQQEQGFKMWMTRLERKKKKMRKELHVHQLSRLIRHNYFVTEL